MVQWGTAKAGRVLAALHRIGWRTKRQSGSHRTLAREGWPDFTWAHHDAVELGPPMLALVDRCRAFILNVEVAPHGKSGLTSYPKVGTAGGATWP